MNLYRCKHCKKLIKRDSNKKWIKSWCVKTDKDVHITLVKRKINGK